MISATYPATQARLRAALAVCPHQVQVFALSSRVAGSAMEEASTVYDPQLEASRLESFESGVSTVV